MKAAPTAGDIARWAETRAAGGAREAAVLSRAEQYQIVAASKRSGMTLEKLAIEFGRSEVEVGRVLVEWTDTTQAAKHLLKARALELTDRMMSDADPAVALEILERLQVVDSSKGGGGAPIVVQIGIGIDQCRLLSPGDDPETV